MMINDCLNFYMDEIKWTLLVVIIEFVGNRKRVLKMFEVKNSEFSKCKTLFPPSTSTRGKRLTRRSSVSKRDP